MIIIVSGSGGTGKSTLARVLAKKLNAKYIDVSELIKDNKLNEKYIKKLDSYEVDINKLNKVIIKLIEGSKKNLVIDSHLSHYMPNKYIDYCIVCKCELKELKKRMEKRGYSGRKIRENLDSEIFDVCLVEALENKHRVIVIDTTKKSVSNCMNEVLKKIK